MPETVVCMMAGRQGERLRPLTDVRAKPAVPFGGVFRIIDFTLPNCLHSGMRRIYVLTQYKSYSLSNHLKTGWNMLSRRMDQFIDEVPAQLQLGESWYQGTADAIRQNVGFEEKPLVPKTIPGTNECLASMGVYLFEADCLLRSVAGESRPGQAGPEIQRLWPELSGLQQHRQLSTGEVRPRGAGENGDGVEFDRRRRRDRERRRRPLTSSNHLIDSQPGSPSRPWRRHEA